jgi:Skp family chaperone for outer membrane proteins
VAAIAIAFAMTVTITAEEQPGTSGLVTVLDVAKVFEDNPTFKSQMEAIKNEAETLKQRITDTQENIRKEAMALQEHEVGTEQRNKLEADLEQRQTQLRTEARQSEQDLLNREAQIYYQTYRTMQEVVTKIAQENGISLVLRFDNSEIDPNSRPEVIKMVNRTVVVHHRLDLTKLVSQQMNARTAGAGTANMK